LDPFEKTSSFYREKRGWLDFERHLLTVLESFCATKTNLDLQTSDRRSLLHLTVLNIFLWKNMYYAKKKYDMLD
jgi:hypothetical protein